jgi:hypothetical protein
MPFHYDLKAPELEPGTKFLKWLVPEGVFLEPHTSFALLVRGEQVTLLRVTSRRLLSAQHAQPGALLQTDQILARMHAGGEDLPQGKASVLVEEYRPIQSRSEREQREREQLLKKLINLLHVSVYERQQLGSVERNEIARMVKQQLIEQGQFPQPSSGGAVLEGASMTLFNNEVQILWQRAFAHAPFKTAESFSRTFTDVDEAIEAYIESEWRKGIDGIPLEGYRKSS